MSRDPIARERIKALRQMIRDGLDVQDRRLDDALDALERAIRTAMTAANVAVAKAEAAVEKRFEGHNEFRKTLGDQAAGFETRDAADAKHKALNETINRIEKQLATSSGKVSGADYLFRIVMGVGLAALTIATFLRT